MLQRVGPFFALAAFLLLQSTPSFAQETRAAVLEKERAEKAASVRPYEPGKLEKWMLWYEEHRILERLSPHDGVYVEYGYNDKVVGSGFGVGTGFRHDLFDRRARIDLGAGITYRNYQMVRADFSLPYLADERFELGARILYQHHPQEDFWGLGMNTIADNRVSYNADFVDVQGRAVARPVDWFQGGVRLGRLSPEIGRGKDKRHPSIEERFSDFEAPGLVDQPAFTYTELFGTVDYRDQPGNARAGGFYSLRWRKYNDADLDRYGFDEVDLHAQQFFPIFDKKRVFAVQARLISTNPGTGHQVPFYLKPTVGGSNSLRSYSDYRFRDDKVLFFNAEYRWEAFSGLDMALFYDRGIAAPDFDSLSLADAEDAYGIGLRFNTYKSVWMRLDIGFGGTEGIKYFFKFSKAF